VSNRDLGSSGEARPPKQRSGGSNDHEVFARIVGGLGSGSLRLPSPFDLVTSAALASWSGAAADFDTVRAGIRPQYRIQIHEVIPGDPVEPRPIVDGTYPDLSTVHLIVEDLVMELAASEEECTDGS
jgi:hypothetical protein